MSRGTEIIEVPEGAEVGTRVMHRDGSSGTVTAINGNVISVGFDNDDTICGYVARFFSMYFRILV